MPRIFRRTPESEEAASYGYRDLLKEIVERTVADTAAGIRRGADPSSYSSEMLLELALSGIGGGTWKMPIIQPHKATKMSSAAKRLVERFSKEGLKYDSWTEQLPGYGYHQWTLYGKGPAKGATFATKTTELREMEEKIADLIKEFSK